MKALPQYVTAFADRHGRIRYRFRKTGHATHYFKARPGSNEFKLEYLACLSGEIAAKIEPGASRTVTGSLNDLIARYYQSPEWRGIPAASTRRVYQLVIEKFRAEHGHRMVVDLRVSDVERLLGRKADTPTAANNLRKRLRQILDFAVRIGMRADNPAAFTRAYRIKSTGFHTWTEDEIAQFEQTHPLGSRARLALALMLYTGQRRSDIVRMGRQHVRNGRIHVVQQKTGTALWIAMHPRLKEAIEATPAAHLTYLVTEFGKPFTPAGFGNWFREKCNEAGLPHCTAHGLRKAMARRLAEIGVGNQGIKAIGGWRGESEVSTYTRAADQTRLADSAISALTDSNLANPENRLAK